MNNKVIFNYDNRIIPFGYIYEENKNSIDIDEIINNVEKSLIVYDTEDCILSDLLSCAQSLLNDENKLIICLVNKSVLKSLRTKGINTGFFRSTEEEIGVSIIIVDKKKYYFAFDKNHIYETKDSKIGDIFQYVNHILWSKTQIEYCQGKETEIKNARLSVVEPNFGKEENNNYDLATKDFNPKELLVTKEENTNKKTIVLHNSTSSCYVFNDDLYINAIKNQYYSISDWKSLIKAKSFENKKLSEIASNQLWINGEKVYVKKSDVLIKNYSVSLDEYLTFKPNFEEIAKEYNGYTLSLTVNVNVLPIELDSSYSIHQNYKNYDNLDSLVSNNLEKLEKLADKKIIKMINKIKEDRVLSERIRKYNELIQNEEFGVSSLVNNKNAFKQINYNERDIIIPSDIIGKMYRKWNKNYFALASKEKVEEAKKWLKDNSFEAVLILGKED